MDNGIVVVENVYRLFTNGYSRLSATKKGVSEIAYPIISSTLTTLAAFVPLLMWQGIVGEFMSILPKTLIVVLASSLFVALIINPPFMANFMKFDDIRTKLNRKRSLKMAGIFAIIAIPLYLAKIYLLANLIMTVAIMYVLNFGCVTSDGTVVSDKIPGMA